MNAPLNGKLKQHKGKIAGGSGLLTVITALGFSGVQFQENRVLEKALENSSYTINEMAVRYETLVNNCLDRIDNE
jgi:hypothetical protein